MGIRNRELKPVAIRLQNKYRALPSGCWEWIGAKEPGGYGVIGKGRRGEGNVRVHRLLYILAHGAVPPGKQVHHVCGNPGCVNPSHLELVSNAENTRRGKRAKLAWHQVDVIRQRVAAGEMQSVVAFDFNIHPAHVSRIVNEKRWSPNV